MKWKECGRKLVAWFKVLSRHLAGGTEESHENLRTAGLRAEIRMRDLQNTKQGC
jgi:hypothetical protein